MEAQAHYLAVKLEGEGADLSVRSPLVPFSFLVPVKEKDRIAIT